MFMALLPRRSVLEHSRRFPRPIASGIVVYVCVWLFRIVLHPYLRIDHTSLRTVFMCVVFLSLFLYLQYVPSFPLITFFLSFFWLIICLFFIVVAFFLCYVHVWNLTFALFFCVSRRLLCKIGHFIHCASFVSMYLSFVLLLLLLQSYLFQMVRGLEFCHARGVMHRWARGQIDAPPTVRKESRSWRAVRYEITTV